MKVSIQGGLGSYSHIAADHIFGKDMDLLQRQSFRKCFEDLANGESEFAVIPFENSTHGSVNENYDLLKANDLYITHELYLKINFHLIGTPDSEISDIKELYTHRVSLSQIKNFLEANTQIDAHEYVDNGRAVELVKDKSDKSVSAAASKLAADIFGMKILKENIHDNPKNYTRFFVLSPKPNYKDNANKTSLQFEVNHEPGSLVKALRIFSDRNINLMKIESRPILNTTWEYTFYVDLMTSLDDDQMKSALDELKVYTRNLRILGTYQSGEYIET